MDITQVAKEIRSILKANFPGTKFSVKSSRFSMGESVDATWTDGPTRSQVDALIGGYGDTRYRFIKTSRKHSIEFANKAVKVWQWQHPEYAHLIITCKGESNCYGIETTEFNGCDNIQDCEDSIYKFLRNSTLESLSLATLPEITDCEPEAVSAPESELVEVATETAPQPQLNQLDSTVDYVLAVYHSYSCPNRKNDEPEYFTLDEWHKRYEASAGAVSSAGCLTSWNRVLERMTITAICCNLSEAKILGQGDLDLTDTNALEADRKQAYAQYLASQQEADTLEAKLAVKKTEAQVYFAIMKEIDERIEAKKREAEVIITEQTQPDFDVRTLRDEKVTLILINTIGFPVCRHITVIAADIVSAKRYHGEMTDKKCLELQYLEKGKRKPRSTRYTEADLAIALGWQNITVPTNDGYIDAFDTGLLSQMISQAKDVVYTQKGL